MLPLFCLLVLALFLESPRKPPVTRGGLISRISLSCLICVLRCDQATGSEASARFCKVPENHASRVFRYLCSLRGLIKSLTPDPVGSRCSDAPEYTVAPGRAAGPSGAAFPRPVLALELDLALALPLTEKSVVKVLAVCGSTSVRVDARMHPNARSRKCRPDKRETRNLTPDR